MVSPEINTDGDAAVPAVTPRAPVMVPPAIASLLVSRPRTSDWSVVMSDSAAVTSLCNVLIASPYRSSGSFGKY